MRCSPSTESWVILALQRGDPDMQCFHEQGQTGCSACEVAELRHTTNDRRARIELRFGQFVEKYEALEDDEHPICLVDHGGDIACDVPKPRCEIRYLDACEEGCYECRLYQRQMMDGIDVVRLWTYLAANQGTTRRILNYLSYLLMATLAVPFLPRPDLLIATSPQFFCGWAGVLTSRMRGVPFVLEIRDIWPESIAVVGALSNRRVLATLEWLELKMYAAADHIVTVGEGYRRRLLEKNVAASRISIVFTSILLSFEFDGSTVSDG